MISLAGSYDSETYSVKREGGHKRTKQKPSHRKGKATAYENNETQPVTIGYRLGFFESVYRTRTIEHLAISSAACTRNPGYRDALNHKTRI